MRKTDDAWVLLSPTGVGHLKVRGLSRQHVQAYPECRGSSPLWDADYEGWLQGNRPWTVVAKGYLDLSQWGPPPWIELQPIAARLLSVDGVVGEPTK